MEDNWFDNFINEVSSSKGKLDFRVSKGTSLQLASHVPYGIPTRIPPLDLAIGRAGWPAGRVVEIIGFEHSGKSCSALSAVASVQRMGGYGVWIDTESCFDPTWAAANGCDPNKIMVCEADCIEGIFQIQEDVIEKYEGMKEKAPIVVVTDSVTGVPSQESLDKDFGEVQRLGTDARCIRNGLRKLAGRMARSKILFIYINHNITNVTGGPYAQPDSGGGHGLKFYAALRIALTRIKNATEGDKTEDKVYKGQEVRITIRKNKIGRTGNVNMLCYLYENGFDIHANLFSALEKIGIIERQSAQKYFFKPTETHLTKREWKTFVEEHSGGADKAYNWFLNHAIEENLIRKYST